MAKRYWNAALHPRDNMGRFAEKFGGKAGNVHGFEPGYRKRIAKNTLSGAKTGAILGAIGGAGFGGYRGRKKLGIMDKAGGFTVPVGNKGYRKLGGKKDRAKYAAANMAFYAGAGALKGAAVAGKYAYEEGISKEHARVQRAAKKKRKGSRKSKYPVSTV